LSQKLLILALLAWLAFMAGLLFREQPEETSATY
jgi:hypothetical protein